MSWGCTVERSVAAATAPAALLKQFDCSRVGLTGQQVAERPAQYGANALTQEHATALGVLVRQFQSALIYS